MGDDVGLWTTKISFSKCEHLVLARAGHIAPLQALCGVLIGHSARWQPFSERVHSAPAMRYVQFRYYGLQPIRGHAPTCKRCARISRSRKFKALAAALMLGQEAA